MKFKKLVQCFGNIVYHVVFPGFFLYLAYISWSSTSICLQRIEITLFLILLVGLFKCIVLITFLTRKNGYELEATAMLWVIYWINKSEKDEYCLEPGNNIVSIVSKYTFFALIIANTLVYVVFCLMMALQSMFSFLFILRTNNQPVLPSNELSEFNVQTIVSQGKINFKANINQPPDSNQNQCSICLDSYQPDELVVRLPVCNHIFHEVCIKTWLHSQNNCPYCRNDLRTYIMENQQNFINEQNEDQISNFNPNLWPNLSDPLHLNDIIDNIDRTVNSSERSSINIENSNPHSPLQAAPYSSNQNQANLAQNVAANMANLTNNSNISNLNHPMNLNHSQFSFNNAGFLIQPSQQSVSSAGYNNLNNIYTHGGGANRPVIMRDPSLNMRVNSTMQNESNNNMHNMSSNFNQNMSSLNSMSNIGNERKSNNEIASSNSNFSENDESKSQIHQEMRANPINMTNKMNRFIDYQNLRNPSNIVNVPGLNYNNLSNINSLALNQQNPNNFENYTFRSNLTTPRQRVEGIILPQKPAFTVNQNTNLIQFQSSNSID